jgi:glycine betaine/choline ABC-type transport system substrate-binding protein
MKQLFEYHGFKVTLDSDNYSEVLRRKMEEDEIDICAEYTGTAWMVYLAKTYKLGMDSNEVYELVKKEENSKGFIWLNPMWNNNTYALASWPEYANEHNLNTLSDLAALYRERNGKIKTYVGMEFATRSDGLPAIEMYYDFKADQVMCGAVATPKESLISRECEVAMVFGTDPEIAQYGWHVYADDKSFFPPYDLTPYIREELLKEYPEIAYILKELIVTFPGGGEPANPEIVAECQRIWQELNAMVDIDKRKPEEVAHEYLIKHGLIK